MNVSVLGDMTVKLILQKENLFKQGCDLLAACDYAAAAACFRAASALPPEEAAAWVNLGISQQGLGLHDEAILSYRKALELEPENSQAVCNLGMAVRSKGEVRETITLFDILIKKGNAPDPILYNQMLCLADIGDHEASFTIKEDLLTHSLPPALRLRTATFFPQIMPGSGKELSAFRDRYESSIRALWSYPGLTDSLSIEEVVGNSFYLAYHGLNDKPLQVEMAAFLRRACPDLSFTAPHCKSGTVKGKKRIRLGVYSNYLRDHTIGRLFGGIFPELDSSRFELFVLAPTPPGDLLSRKLAASVEHFLQVPSTIAEARRFIADLELDVLLYTDIGMDRVSYALAFARLAPVQCVTWGHPVTSGIDSIDYFITAKDLESMPGYEVYSEKPLVLSTPGFYYARPELKCSKKPADFGLPEDARLYLCVQSLFKIHPDFDEIARSILESDSHGRLVLVGKRNEFLCNRIAAGNKELARRIQFVGSMPRDEFLALIATVDLLLDTPHFSGGNTSIECFAMGQPLITMPSFFLKGRISTALYRKMGIHDAVVSTKDEYVRMALTIANNPDYRASLSTRITDSTELLFRDRAVIDELDIFLGGCRSRA